MCHLCHHDMIFFLFWVPPWSSSEFHTSRRRPHLSSNDAIYKNLKRPRPAPTQSTPTQFKEADRNHPVWEKLIYAVAFFSLLLWETWNTHHEMNVRLLPFCYCGAKSSRVIQIQFCLVWWFVSTLCSSRKSATGFEIMRAKLFSICHPEHI